MPDWSPPDPVRSDYTPKADVSDLLDKTFGKGRWKLTSGYRTPGQEDALRKSGAGTVRAGALSHHSMGTEDAPGAYDIVVDGLSPSQARDKLKGTGVKFEKLFAEPAHGAEGDHLHIEPEPSPQDWKPPDAIVAASATPKPTTPPPAAPPAKPTPLQLAGQMAGDVGMGIARSVGHVGMETWRGQIAGNRAAMSDLMTPESSRPLNEQVADAAIPVARPTMDLMQAAGGGIAGLLKAAVGEPVVNTLKATVGDPVKGLTGGRYELDPQGVGDALSMIIPGVGEENAARTLAARAGRAGVSREVLGANEAQRAAAPVNSLKAATKRFTSTDPAHAAAVQRLERAGVAPAQHQRIGGQIQRFAESAKSDPYVGSGIRKAEQEASDSFNRALYNKVLAPTGERLPANVPVGRDGVAAVEKRLSAAYDRVLPHVRLSADKALTDQLAGIRTGVAKLGRPQEQQYEAILNQDVLHHFGPEGMDGKTFKSVESDLLRQSRALKGSPDPNARGLGHALEDTLDALRQDMIDHSPAKYRKEIQEVNRSYAMFTRLQDAAALRKGGRGEITPGDLLGAVKKGDRSIRKGSFARGDALLQDFAEDADRVLSPRHGTSHTPEIQNNINFLRGHGVLGGTLGAVAGGVHGGVEGASLGAAAGGAADMAMARLTNMAARRALAARSAAAPTNYLKAAQQRSLAPAVGLGAISAPTGGTQR